MATTKKPAPKKTKKPLKTTKVTSKNAAAGKPKFRRPDFTLSRLRQYIVPFLIALSVALLGIAWYYKIYTDPKNIFWGMVGNNLSTPGFSKESSQETGSFVSKEINLISFSPDLSVISLRDIVDSTQQPPTHIRLEALGTPGSDYQHYQLIDRPAAAGKPKPDYSKIYNLWLKSGAEGSQLINSNLFGPVLFGNLDERTKQSVLADLRKSYKVDYLSFKKLNLDGRRTYSFDVEVGLGSYAAAAKKYARGLGLAVADQIDPKNYSAKDKTKVTIYVDALSRQVRKIQYSSGNTFENYTGYGIGKKLTLPAKTVGSEEFQKAINSVSGE